MPAVRHCSVGPPRSAIHGRVAATPASCRGAHYAIPACGHRGLTGRLRSKAEQQQRQSAKLHSPVGAAVRRFDLRANAVYQSIYPSLTHRIREQARSHKRHAHDSTIRSAVRPPRFACEFDLRRPVKPRWPSSDIDFGSKPAGRRFSRAGPWMAHRGDPQNQCRMTGTPSLGEVPSGGARAFCLLLRCSKVSRCKSGTYSRRDRGNGYVHIPRRASCVDTHGYRRQASSHIGCMGWLIFLPTPSTRF